MPYDPSHASVKKKPAPQKQDDERGYEPTSPTGPSGRSGFTEPAGSSSIRDQSRDRSPSGASQRPLSSSGPSLTVNPVTYAPAQHPSSPRQSSPARPAPSSPKFPNQHYQAYRPPAQKEYVPPPAGASPHGYAAYHPPSGSPPLQKPAAKPASPLPSSPTDRFSTKSPTYPAVAKPQGAASTGYDALRPGSSGGPKTQGPPTSYDAPRPGSSSGYNAQVPQAAYDSFRPGSSGGHKEQKPYGQQQQYGAAPSTTVPLAAAADSIVSTPEEYAGKRKDDYYNASAPMASHPEQYYQAAQMQGAQAISPTPSQGLGYQAQSPINNQQGPGYQAAQSPNKDQGSGYPGAPGPMGPPHSGGFYGSQGAAQTPDGRWTQSPQQTQQGYTAPGPPPPGQNQSYMPDINQYMHTADTSIQPGLGGQPNQQGLKRQYSIPITTSIYELPTSAAEAAAAGRTKTITVQLPESGVYAERVDSFMKMLETEASLEPTPSPTLSQVEPEDLISRRNKVFRNWVVAEAQKRGPNFATELADELDGLSFGATRNGNNNANRMSQQLPLSDPHAALSPRGAGPPQQGLRNDQEYFQQDPQNQQYQQQQQQQQQQQVYPIDITMLLPLLYPQVPANPSAASKLAPYQATYSSISDIIIPDQKREAFRKKQEEIEKTMKREIEDIRRRRKNSKEAESMIRELKKRENADQYARFERDVVNEAYPALMKQNELLEEVRSGVESIITGSGAIVLTAAEKLEILSFLEDVHKTSTSVHHQMESLLTERSMQYMHSITLPLYDAGNTEEAKKVEAWNAKTLANQAVQAKKQELERVENYVRVVTSVTEGAISGEKEQYNSLLAALDPVMRAIDACLRINGRLDIIIPPNEPVEFDRTSEAGKLIWLRTKLLSGAVILQEFRRSLDTLYRIRSEAKKRTIAATGQVKEAEATAKYPDNIAKRNEDINKGQESRNREVEQIVRDEGKEKEDREAEWKAKIEGPLRPISDALKYRAIQAGGEAAQSTLNRQSEDSILAWN